MGERMLGTTVEKKIRVTLWDEDGELLATCDIPFATNASLDKFEELYRIEASIIYETKLGNCVNTAYLET